MGSRGKLQNLKLDLSFWGWGKVEGRDNKGDCLVFYLSVPITLTEITQDHFERRHGGQNSEFPKRFEFTKLEWKTIAN